jgi:ATP-binding cassette subfamily B protein
MTQPIQSPDFEGDLHVRRASLWYGDFQALKDISLDLPARRITAFIGPSGCGKSTLLKCFNRMNDLVDGCRISGQICIGDTDVYGKIDVNLLRRRVGMVFQKPNPFPMSVYDNIAYGLEGATREEVVRAAKAAHIHRYIESLPQGYDTVLSDDGVNISKGQKQLITIARAMLPRSAMLILDEATSNVDSRTEHKIQEAMLSLMHGRTCFVIAHRLSTIQHADLILVLRDGCIIEQGNHEQLLASGGFYSSLYNAQFR